MGQSFSGDWADSGQLVGDAGEATDCAKMSHGDIVVCDVSLDIAGGCHKE